MLSKSEYYYIDIKSDLSVKAYMHTQCEVIGEIPSTIPLG